MGAKTCRFRGNGTGPGARATASAGCDTATGKSVPILTTDFAARPLRPLRRRSDREPSHAHAFGEALVDQVYHAPSRSVTSRSSDARRRVAKRLTDVVLGQLRELGHDLCSRHSLGDDADHRRHRHARADNARDTRHDRRVDGDPLERHGSTLRPHRRAGKRDRTCVVPTACPKAEENIGHQRSEPDRETPNQNPFMAQRPHQRSALAVLPSWHAGSIPVTRSKAYALVDDNFSLLAAVGSEVRESVYPALMSRLSTRSRRWFVTRRQSRRGAQRHGREWHLGKEARPLSAVSFANDERMPTFVAAVGLSTGGRSRGYE